MEETTCSAGHGSWNGRRDTMDFRYYFCFILRDLKQKQKLLGWQQWYDEQSHWKWHHEWNQQGYAYGNELHEDVGPETPEKFQMPSQQSQDFDNAQCNLFRAKTGECCVIERSQPLSSHPNAIKPFCAASRNDRRTNKLAS